MGPLPQVAILGVPAARELLDVLKRPSSERAAVIGRLFDRDDTTTLAEALIDAEADDFARAQLVDVARERTPPSISGSVAPDLE